MASQPPRRVLEPLSAPQHFMPPSARELRAQAVQRLQTGLFGIAAILLIVGVPIYGALFTSAAVGVPEAEPLSDSGPLRFVFSGIEVLGSSASSRSSFSPRDATFSA